MDEVGSIASPKGKGKRSACVLGTGYWVLVIGAFITRSLSSAQCIRRKLNRGKDGGMKRLGPLALHLFSLAALGLLVPACGGKNDGGGGGGGASSSSATALFSEEFNGAFPGTSWSPPGGGGIVQIDSANGDPAP